MAYHNPKRYLEGFLSYNTRLTPRFDLPISRNEFEKLNPMEPTLDKQVLDFLHKNRELAYTPMEIAEALNPNPALFELRPEQVDAILENLRAREKVVGRWREAQPKPETYYAAP